MAKRTNEDVWNTVQKAYGAIASSGAGCCASGSCGASARSGPIIAHAGSSLGSGDPIAHAELQAGERVVDLGSGRGEDSLAAAARVGPSGSVIGVDMTSEMVARARSEAHVRGVDHVEFLKGQIEAVPVEDEWADVVISNCVFNLSPDKERALREALRILRPGGRLVVSDMVLNEYAVQSLLDDAALVGCLAGAATVSQLRQLLERVGFVDIRIHVQTLASDDDLSDYGTALVQARRPDEGARKA